MNWVRAADLRVWDVLCDSVVRPEDGNPGRVHYLYVVLEVGVGITGQVRIAPYYVNAGGWQSTYLVSGAVIDFSELEYIGNCYQ